MKPIHFVGSSQSDLKAFPKDVRVDAGYELHRLQQGLEPHDWKPMTSVGQGVREIRVRGKDGAYRIIYVTNIGSTIYVLHAFNKKTQKTEQKDIEVALGRLKAIRG